MRLLLPNAAWSADIDLLLTDANRHRAVIDVKWGSQGYRRGLLVENRALQLATYAYLEKTLDAAGAGRTSRSSSS